VYNVVDDEPAGRGQVIDYASSLIAGHMASVLHEMPKMQTREARPPSPTRPERMASGLSSQASIDEFDSCSVGLPVMGGYSTSMASSGGSTSEDERGVEVEKLERMAVGGGGSEERETRAEEREYMPGVAATPNGEKRVKNDLIKQELGVVLEFPTYREGLSAIAQGDMRPF
jgi:hypothetical protein